MSVGSEVAQHSPRQHLIRTTCALAAMLVLSGCTTIPRTPYTSADAASARVLNLDGLRRYADEPALAFLKDTNDVRGQIGALETLSSVPYASKLPSATKNEVRTVAIEFLKSSDHMKKFVGLQALMELDSPYR